MITGPPGVGKSEFTIWIAGRVPLALPDIFVEKVLLQSIDCETVVIATAFAVAILSVTVLVSF